MPQITARRILAALPVVAVLWAPAASAEDSTFSLTIRNHRFEPETITVPANTRFRLMIENADPTPEEFESHTLNREKVIPGKSKAVVLIGPLKAGTYPFVGEFHEATAKGKIVAK